MVILHPHLVGGSFLIRSYWGRQLKGVWVSVFNMVLLRQTLKKIKKKSSKLPFKKTPRGGRVGLVITCTFTARWVASRTLYRFQLPAADGSREACEPRPDLASLITKCGLKKGLSRTPQGIKRKNCPALIRRGYPPHRQTSAP